METHGMSVGRVKFFNDLQGWGIIQDVDENMNPIGDGIKFSGYQGRVIMMKDGVAALHPTSQPAREPEKGDILVFTRRNYGRRELDHWGYLDDIPES